MTVAVACLLQHMVLYFTHQVYFPLSRFHLSAGGLVRNQRLKRDIGLEQHPGWEAFPFPSLKRTPTSHDDPGAGFTVASMTGGSRLRACPSSSSPGFPWPNQGALEEDRGMGNEGCMCEDRERKRERHT